MMTSNNNAHQQPRNISTWLISAVIGVVLTAGLAFSILSIAHGRTEVSIRQSLFEQQILHWPLQ